MAPTTLLPARIRRRRPRSVHAILLARAVLFLALFAGMTYLVFRPSLFFTIAPLNPLAAFVGLAGVIAVAAETYAGSTLLTTALLPLLAIVLGGRTFLYAFARDKRLCYDTPWLEEDEGLRGECSIVLGSWIGVMVVAAMEGLVAGARAYAWVRRWKDGKREEEGGAVARLMEDREDSPDAAENGPDGTAAEAALLRPERERVRVREGRESSDSWGSWNEE